MVLENPLNNLNTDPEAIKETAMEHKEVLIGGVAIIGAIAYYFATKQGTTTIPTEEDLTEPEDPSYYDQTNPTWTPPVATSTAKAAPVKKVVKKAAKKKVVKKAAKKKVVKKVRKVKKVKKLPKVLGAKASAKKKKSVKCPKGFVKKYGSNVCIRSGKDPAYEKARAIMGDQIKIKLPKINFKMPNFRESPQQFVKNHKK